MPPSTSRPIERIAAAERERFLADFHRRSPVVLTGALAGWDQSLFDWDALAARFGATRVRTYRVPAASRMSSVDRAFYVWTDEDAARGHLREWTFGELVAALRAGEPHYCMANRTKNVALRDLLAGASGVLGCASAAGEMEGRAAREFFVGSEAVGPGLHHDGPVESFLCQLAGTKRVNAFAPTDAPYVYPAADGHAHFSRLGDSFNVDAASFPLFAKATAHACELQPGEALYMPPHWFHDPSPTGPNAMASIRCMPRA